MKRRSEVKNLKPAAFFVFHKNLNLMSDQFTLSRTTVVFWGSKLYNCDNEPINRITLFHLNTFIRI